MLRHARAALALLITSLPAHAAPMDGVWQTEGYGYLVDIRNGQATLYETTALSCIESALKAGPVQPGGLPGAEARFAVSLRGFIDAEMIVYPGAGPDTKLFQRTDTVTRIGAHRLPELPQPCRAAPAADFAATHAVFTETFREQYPFFEAGRAAWPADAPAANTPAEQFETLVALMAPLADMHTALLAPSADGYYFGADGADTMVPPESRDRLAQRVEDRYLTADATYYGGRQIAFGPLSEDVAYLRVDSLSGYTEAGDLTQDRQALQAALHDIGSRMQGMSALIVDLRANAGGSDRLALDLAGWLAREPYTAYRKQAVKAGAPNADDVAWTEAAAVTVEPSAEAGFTGKLVLLTGRYSLGAAETFTMALMARTPAAVRVGENTHGSFSAMLPRTLPNGWTFALPNERYLDATGRSYDHIGIPPHIPVPALIEGERDLALETALTLLRGEAGNQATQIGENRP